MLAPPALPPVPVPPNDPTWLVLDPGTGWQEALRDGTEQNAGGALTLARLPFGGRRTAEASGSLGGVVPPLRVAVADDGAIFLLDPRTATVKIFDPCACAFSLVPAIGGQGPGARQFLAPGGIALGAGNLYVCDTGHARLSVFALPGYALRGHWRPPATTANAGWQPVDVAVDTDGTVFVADPAGGCVHRFDRSGRWEALLGGFGAVRRVALDCTGRLYVLVDGEAGVRVVDRDGIELDRIERPDHLYVRFPEPLLATDAQGRLDLTGQCIAGPHPRSCECRGQGRTGSAAAPSFLFEPDGSPSTAPVAPTGPVYEARGTWIAGPLDSEIYRCQWHRIVLDGRLASGTRLTVSTFTAETALTVGDVLDAEELWQTRQVVTDEIEGWDCLVRSGGGRFLWLRLAFEGDGVVSPCVDRIRIEFPRISLRRYLPAVYGSEPVSTDFTDRFLSLFDTTIRSVERQVDDLASLFDPRSAPATGPAGSPDFLTWLATWVGVALDRQWSVERRRRWLRAAVRLYPLRGTLEGLRRALLVFLGMDLDDVACCTDDDHAARRCACPDAVATSSERGWRPPMLILEHFRLRRWLFVGQGRLGDAAVLWGQGIVDRSQLGSNAQIGGTALISTPDPFHDPIGITAHRFTVFVPERCATSDAERRSLENLLAAEKPAHTLAKIEYVGPRFRIGRQSMLGFDAVIGRYAEGVTLEKTHLGSATVLTGAGGTIEDPALVVGRQSRIGATTRLA